MDRPWEPWDMSTEAWRQIRPRPVRIALLHPSQEGLTWAGLFAATSYSGDRWPHVVRYRGELHIDDGHHRIARSALRGRRWVLARVKEAGDGPDRERKT